MPIKPQKQEPTPESSAPEQEPNIKAMPAPPSAEQSLAAAEARLRAVTDELATTKRSAASTEKRLRDELRDTTAELDSLKESPVIRALENAGSLEPMEKKFMELCKTCLDAELPVKGKLVVSIVAKTGTSGRDEGSLDFIITHKLTMPSEREAQGRLFMEDGKLVEATAKQADMFKKRRGDSAE